MPSGHTERATINKRRPMTENMRRALKIIADAQARRDPVFINERDYSCGFHNGCRALFNRGYIEEEELFGRWRVTEAGRDALRLTGSAA